MSDVIYNNYARYFNDTELIEEFNLNEMIPDESPKISNNIVEEFTLNDLIEVNEKPKLDINYDLYKDNLLRKIRDNLTLHCTLSLDESDYVIDAVLNNKNIDYDLLSHGNNMECLKENVKDLKLYSKNSKKIKEINSDIVERKLEKENKKLKNENLLKKKNEENRKILIKYDFIDEEDNKTNDSLSFSVIVFFILVISYIIKKYFGCK